VTFGHRPPPAVRFAALGAAVLDLILGLALVVIGMQSPEMSALRYVGLFLIGTGWLLPWILLSVSYEVESGELRVRRAFLHRRIPLDAIEEIRSGGTGGALVIEYRAGARRGIESISPEDPSALIQHVLMSAPQMQATGDGGARRRA